MDESFAPTIESDVFKINGEWTGIWPAERAAAVREILTRLFYEHPMRQHPEIDYSAATCRDRAMHYAQTGECDAALFWACDTGVPNDILISNFRLLNPFGATT